jgi:hypothetical protein
MPPASPLASAAPAAAPLIGRNPLKIVVLEGEGAFNDMRRKIGRDVVVEVRDERDRPVAGAQVTFMMPSLGPSGAFPGGARTFTTATDSAGRATTPGLRPNSTEGRFNIKVTANWNGQEGSLVVAQSNTLAGGTIVPGGGGSKKKWLILSGIAGGAAVGIVAAVSGGGSSAAQTGAPTVLSSGGVTVGGPR